MMPALLQQNAQKRKAAWGRTVLFLVLLFVALMFLFPLFLIFLNCLKSQSEIMSSLLSLPTQLHFENFPQAVKKMNYGQSFMNSVLITVFSVAGIVLLASMCAYQVVRRKCFASKLISGLMLASMAIPFQVLMVPSVIVARELKLVNSQYGLILMYWGFLLPMAMFLYQGFIKGVPRELEEAAMIDGAGQIKTFFAIVFPMLKPITATVVILNVMGVFNDFTMPLIMLSSKNTKTLPLAFSVFYGSYANEWQLIMAALVLTVVPVLIFFLLMQKNIMDGLTAGALKG